MPDVALILLWCCFVSLGFCLEFLLLDIVLMIKL